MVGQVNTPAGGVPWEIFTPTQRSAIERYSAQYNIPIQVMMNMLWQESGTGSIADGTARLDPNAVGGTPDIRGIAQINMANTGPGLGVTDPLNEDQSIRAMALGLQIYGTGGVIGSTPERTQVGTLPFDVNRGVVFYNLGPGRTESDPRGISGGRRWEASGRTWLPEETRNYENSAFRGVTGYNPGQPLPHWGQPLSSAELWRQNDQTLGILGPLNQYSEDPAWGALRNFWSQFGDPSNPTSIDPSNWHGDTGQEIGPNTGLDFTAPLPYAGTGLTGQSLQDWIASPTGGQQVAGLSERAGYTLAPDVIEFVGRTAPELGRGPEGFTEGNLPWFEPGRITQDVGAVLQHHALMPNNLVYNPDTQQWDVPFERRFPSNTGIWGAQRVADWLPTAGSGFETDYLRHLGYGAPPAGNLYGGAPYSGIGTFGMGNQGFGNIADMSTYNHQPFDWSQFLPGPSTHNVGNAGNPGNLASGFDMNLYNQTAGIGGGNRGGYQPDFSVAGPAGYPIDYQHYFQTAGLPSGGFGYPGLPPPGTYSGPGIQSPTAIETGLGYEGSSGITTLPDPGLANAIGIGQYQNYYANMNAASNYSPIAAYPGPVVYNNPQITQNYATPATNSGQVFGGGWTTTPLAVGNTNWY